MIDRAMISNIMTTLIIRDIINILAEIRERHGMLRINQVHILIGNLGNTTILEIIGQGIEDILMKKVIQEITENIKFILSLIKVIL